MEPSGESRDTELRLLLESVCCDLCCFRRLADAPPTKSPVTLPAALPVIFAALRLAWGIALIVVIAAEFARATS
jgi:hypothetical protein